MKMLAHKETSLDEKRTVASVPITVCMHVMGAARNDGRVMRSATALVAGGYSVTIVDIEHTSIATKREVIRGVNVKHVVTPRLLNSRVFKVIPLIKAMHKVLLCTLRLLQTPADIYHAHDTLALFSCYIAAKLHRKPFIFDAHELPFSESASAFIERMSGFFKFVLARIIGSFAGIITVSAPIGREICASYGYSKVTLVRNIPPYREVQRGDYLREHLHLGSEVRVALYQGGLMFNRGLDMLVRAAKFLAPDVMIVMMGPQVGSTQANLESLIASEGVADRVKILPPVPYDVLLEWTASADIGLIVYAPDFSLNVKMCLPNKLFEYIMAGLPVLASPLDAVAEMIDAYDIGQVVSSLAPEDIGAAINTMIMDQAACERMRSNALNAAKRELSWEKESQQLLKLYNDILANRGKGS